MTEPAQATPDRPLAAAPVGPWTKGLALDGPSSLQAVAAPHPPVTADTFCWPLLTLDDAALEHNLAPRPRSAVRRACSTRRT